ncbi:MAG: MBL fold metallo-hydrolase [Solirubrobacterales bacterium]|nr:MBL fold metallo-hydrolase [Solirubrobacterales bacterium]MBV9798037.1 MBL fold metallo-hydrolase [Solirubrobacterales bacterium]
MPRGSQTPYTRGLHELGDGLFAFLQPDGSWGWSNAGLVVGEGTSLLIDTLFDLRLTREMLDQMRPATGPGPIRQVLNTHGNGDHWYGNQLVPAEAEIVASAAAIDDMQEVPPTLMHTLAEADLDEALATFVRHAFAPFRFDGIEMRLPTRTFTGSLTLDVAGRRVELLDLGPAHTRADVIAYVPDARTVFTGDILFVGGTPIMWAGPVSNWLAACEHIEALDVDTVVPGHGPVTDKDGPRQVRRYLEHVRDEAAERHAAGMPAAEAALDIDLGEFADWSDPERIAVNVESIYAELDPAYERPPAPVLLTRMGAYLRGRRA